MRLRIICSYFDPSPGTHRLWETLGSLKKMQRPTRAGSVSADGSELSAAPFQELGFQSRGSCCQAQGGGVRGWRYSPGTGHMGAAPRPLQLPGPFNHRSDSQHWGLHLSLDCQFM